MKTRLTLITLILTTLLGLVIPTQVHAQDFCDTFPVLCQVTGNNKPGAGDAQDYVLNRVTIIVSLIFFGIITTGVFIVIRAGYMYISSQGNDKMIAQSQDSIKNVFIGIALLFVGILGIILVLSFFGGEELLNGGIRIEDLLTPRN